MNGAAEGDRGDPLAHFRERFHLPEGRIYLDGNSLGALPRATADRLREVLREEWGNDLIAAWNRHGWIDLPARVGGKIAALIGARPGEVLAADSTSVNLFKLLFAALRLRPGRRTVLIDPTDFPTDRYIAAGLTEALGEGYRLRQEEDLAAGLDDSVAVLLASHVHYRSGVLRDLPGLTAAAHEAGALTVWDLAHSAGAMPLDLEEWGADLAVGCGYKFLNGGPGAPAFLYVRRDLQESAQTPLAGWLGHADPFAFAADYEPAPGVRRFLCGTPSILGLAALEVGVDLVAEADPSELRRKSLALGEAFIRGVEERCAGHGLELASPSRPEDRGSQIAWRHPQGFSIVQALIEAGVVGDFRAPDILRFGLAPLYLRYRDIEMAVEILSDILDRELWRRERFRRRQTVT